MLLQSLSTLFQKGWIYFKLIQKVAVKAAGVRTLLKRSQALFGSPCFTSSDRGLLIPADVPRDGEQVLSVQSFLQALALRMRAEQLLIFWLGLLYLSCSALASPPLHLTI